jgi:hypothetical protein
MRILPDNLAIVATLTALHTNLNYPESNLKHEWLTKIWKSTENDDTITVTFPEDQIIDCIYLGFTNSPIATVRLYSAAAVLLSTKVIDTTVAGTVFSAISGVRSIQIDLSFSVPVFLGGIGTGRTYTMPDPLNGVVKDFDDNTKIVRSDGGQVLMNKKAWLRSVPLSFVVLDLDQYNEIYAILADVDRPIWIDIYEERKNLINPIYGVMTMSKPSQSWKVWKFDAQVLEAR